MKLSTYTVIITYLMAALGVSAIWLIEAMEPSFVVMTASFILLSLVFNVRKRQVLPGPLWNALAVAILVFFVVDYITISTSLIISSTRFATVLLVLKLFQVHPPVAPRVPGPFAHGDRPAHGTRRLTPCGRPKFSRGRGPRVLGHPARASERTADLM